MKFDSDGNVIEATRAELLRYYYQKDMDDMFTFSEYLELLKYRGVDILEEES